MRRKNIKNAHEKLYNYVGLLIEDPTICYEELDKVFPKVQPIHIEIGMGKGKFITELAKRNPDINYIGLEKFESVLLQACKKHETAPDNLRLICVDAENLDKIFKPNTIDKIYLNFSDPWPKTRHEKRRLTSEKFIKLYEQITKKPTTIEFKTDNRALFEYSIKSFNEQHYHFERISLNLHEDEQDLVTTEYEDRFSEKGNPIYFMEVKK